MADHLKKGWIGEKIAFEYIANKGYSILETNWRVGHKEIDLIAQDGNDIVFIEVRVRSSSSLKTAKETINRKKENNIITAANKYLKMYSINLNARFDIIAIDIKEDKTYTLEYIKSAFYPRLRSRR